MATDRENPGDIATREAYEEVHVHQVYSQIAQHFSSTRYKVSAFSLLYRFPFSFIF